MGEDEIRHYLASRQERNAGVMPRMVVRRARRKVQDTFQDFSATHLFCPTCKSATPVKEKLLLYLADGDLYGYCCTVCGTSVGTRKAGEPAV